MNTSRVRNFLLVYSAAVLAGASPLAWSSVNTDNFVAVSKASPKRAVPAPRASAAPQRALNVATVSGPGPGQAGYVHYFVITGPDGEPETQVGIELEDGRIAWSFPEAGVVIAPFIPLGYFTAGGNNYEIEHLYGFRPFRNQRSLRALQRELAARVAPYVDENTPYCDEAGNSPAFCVSCLGFVLRVLYPGAGRLLPALPADFKSAQKTLYSTEDLLMYLSGIPVDAPRAVRSRHIQALAVPDALRDELTRISTSISTSTVASKSKPRRVTNAKVRAAAPPTAAPKQPARRGS